MTKLSDSIDSIVDNISDGDNVSVVVNFLNKDVLTSLDSMARLSEIEMFGGSDVLPDSELPESTIKKRRKSRASRLKALKTQNEKSIKRLTTSTAETGIKSRVSKKEAIKRDLWLSNSYQATFRREALARLRKKPHLIESVVADAVVEAPRAYVSSSSVELDGDVWGISYVDAPEAWITGPRGANVSVSVIDTGIAPHEAINNVTHASEAQFEYDEQGRLQMKEYVDLRTSSDRGDGMGHGTHVAGTIAGKTHDGKIIGIAPDATLMSSSVFDGSKTTISAIIRGMQWSVDNGADIINMSLGAFDRSRWLGNYDAAQAELGWAHDAYNNAISNANRAGCLVVAAIGNDGAGSTKTPGSCLGSLAVGAMSKDGRCAGFSGGAVLVYHKDGSYSSNYIKPDVSAPGVNIKSSDRFGHYTTASGTSMATPCVSGVAALVLSSSDYLGQLTDPYHKAVMLKYVLKYSANNDLGEFGSDTRYGQGVVNAQEAVKLGRDSVRMDSIYTRLMNAGMFD